MFFAFHLRFLHIHFRKEMMYEVHVNHVGFDYFVADVAEEFGADKLFKSDI